MRLFLTSYDKSGTHQIMPALRILPHLVDTSHNNQHVLPEYLKIGREIGQDGVEATCKRLREFKNRAFGHVTYLPEFAKAIQAEPTRIIFNIRDPRDVIVAEYYNMKKAKPGMGWLNFWIPEKECYVVDDDPISHLIDFAVRWKVWLGWMKDEFTYVVRYEDLRTKGMETCISLYNWISHWGIVIDPAYVINKRLAPTHDNPTFRKGIIGEWKEVFTDKQKEKCERVLGDIIQEMGYEL